MDVTPSLADFAAEVHSFLDANAAPALRKQSFRWGEGSDAADIFVELDETTEQAALAEAKRFRAARFDAGLAWITGPAAYGGRDLTQPFEDRYREIALGYLTPSPHLFGIGLGMVAPTILAHGHESVRSKYLAALFRGDLIACQMFSEPGAGSDLASVATRAEPTDGGWRITGQKVWTTNAHVADLGEVIARTDPSAPKHRGLTAFLIDMHAPGVTVRPLRQMTGGASFNEVFLDAVFVPDDHRLGEVDDGWRVALTTLMNERASIGANGEASAAMEFLELERLVAQLDHAGLRHDPLLRQELAAIFSAQQIARWSGMRAMEKLRAGQTPGPELSMAKLARTTNLTRVAEFIARTLGPKVLADSGEWGQYAWTQFLLGVPGLRIAGGTDEIQRKILSERVLGLPPDPSPGGQR